jgi:glucokinase
MAGMMAHSGVADPIPVLEIGGSHVTSALVDLAEAQIVTRHDLDLTPDAGRDELLAVFATAGGRLEAVPGRTWGVAMPGPFDYELGIGRFTGVGKFESLNGVDVGAALAGHLAAGGIRFLNDADAFGIGEAAVGAAQAYERAVCLTLGSGIGSVFLDHGLPVKSGGAVPPEGFVHVLGHEGRNIEDLMSRRALRAAYRQAAGHDVDVKEIAERARAGEPAASQVWAAGFAAMTAIIGPWLARFQAQAVVVGGSIAKSWDLVEPALSTGFARAGAPVPVIPAARPAEAALFGAARWSLGAGRGV